MTLPPVMDQLDATVTPTQRSGWQLRRGAMLVEGGVTFSVWAPSARDVSVHVAGGESAGDHALSRVDGERGVWSATVAGVVAGDRYGFRIDDADGTSLVYLTDNELWPPGPQRPGRPGRLGKPHLEQGQEERLRLLCVNVRGRPARVHG